MKLAPLVLRPRAFFAEQTGPLGWVWPVAGFYLFAFAGFFRNFIVHDYRMPYWLVVYVVAWLPTLSLAAAFFVLFVLLWYWPASAVLGEGQSVARGAQIVGISLLPAGIFFCAILLALAVLKGNDLAAPYALVVGAAHAVAGLWAVALIVVGAAVSNRFTARKTALFVLWLVLLVVLLGALVLGLAGGRLG